MPNNYLPLGGVSIQRSELDVEWQIPDYLKIMPHLFDSPVFTFSGLAWYLKLVWNNDGRGFIAVSLHPKDSPTNDKSLTVSLGLRKSNGLVHSRDTSHRTFEKSLSWNECSCFWTRNDVLEQESELLPSGTLTIVCSLQEKEDRHEAALNVTGLDTLSSSFNELFISQKHHDALIKVGELEFRAHKAVLACRSPVFEAAFEHDMSEKRTGIVSIDDCDPDSFGTFLQYLYTGQAEDVSFRDAYHLYITADKYDVPELKAACIAHLTKNMSIRNVSEVVSLADLHDEMVLMSSAQTFFNRNVAKILETDEWETLVKTNYPLASKLLREMACKVKIQD